MSGYKDWSGVAVNNADMDDFLQLQTVMKYASVAARAADTALADVWREGAMFYLTDLNTIQVARSGTAEQVSTVGPVHGALTSWTPTWTQTATITKTVNEATYQRIGRRVTANIYMTANSAGTGGGVILVTLPVTASAGVTLVGDCSIFNTSTGIHNVGIAFAQSTTTFGLIMNGATGLATALDGAEAIASTDILYANLMYEAGGDA